MNDLITFDFIKPVLQTYRIGENTAYEFEITIS